MTQLRWKASVFLAKTSYEPVQHAVIGILSFVILTLIVASFYQVDQRVIVYGEVVSVSGELEIASPNDGVIEMKPLEIGQVIRENETIGFIKIPFTDHERVNTTLIQLHRLLESTATEAQITMQRWPDLDSENPFIAEQLLNAKDALDKFENEVRNKTKLIELQTKNLVANRIALQRRVNVFASSKNRSLTEGLIEDQNREIVRINEELAKIENENLVKTSEIKSQLLAALKSAYLQIYQYRDSHVVKSSFPGKVTKVFIGKSKRVKRDETIIALSSIDEEFELKLQIPTHQAGKLSPNLQIKAEIDSFPYQKYGMFPGRIKRIDKMLTRNDQSVFYNAFSSIEIPTQSSRKVASTIQLIPGMKVKAHIVLKKVTILNLVFEKLFMPNENL